MKSRIGIWVAGLVMVVGFVGCNKDDDKDFASIIGTWQGTSIDYEFIPSGSSVGVNETDSDFDGIVQFDEDGTATYSDDGSESSGTYTINGSKLTTDVEFSSTFEITSQDFTIKKLTETQLTLYIKEQGNFEIPDVGTFDGTLKATIHFTRQ